MAALTKGEESPPMLCFPGAAGTGAILEGCCVEGEIISILVGKTEHVLCDDVCPILTPIVSLMLFALDQQQVAEKRTAGYRAQCCKLEGQVLRT